MSLKSFDKFCENIIMGEPAKYLKDVFDERQNQLRGKLICEAFQLYAVLSFLALIIYEAGYAYCEGVMAILAFCGSVSYLWWVLRGLHFGCLIGIKFTQTANAAGLLIGQMVMFGFFEFRDFSQDRQAGESFFANNGQLTESFVLVIAMAIMLIASVMVLVAVSRHKSAENSAAEEEDV